MFNDFDKTFFFFLHKQIVMEDFIWEFCEKKEEKKNGKKERKNKNAPRMLF